MENSNIKYRSKSLKLLAIFMVLMILLTILSNAANSLTVAQVNVTKAKRGALIYNISSNGNLEVNEKVKVKSEEGFFVKDILVEKGDYVKKGDTLLTLDNQPIKDNLFSKKIELQKLELELQKSNINSNSSIYTKQTELELAKELPQTIEQQTELKLKRVNEDLELAIQDLELAKNKLFTAKQKDEKQQLENAQLNIDKANEDLENIKYEKQQALQQKQFAVDDAKLELEEVIKNKIALADKEYTKALQAYKDTETTWNNKINQNGNDSNLAYNNLTQAQQNYEEALQNGDEEAMQLYQQRIQEYQSDYDTKYNKIFENNTEKEKALKEAQKAINDAKTEKDVNAENEKIKAEANLKRAEDIYDITQKDYDRKILKAEESLKKAEEELQKIQNGELDDTAILNAQQNVEIAEQAIKQKQREIEDIYIQKEQSLLDANKSIETKEFELEQLQKGLEQQSEKDNIDRNSLLIDISVKQKEIEQLNQLLTNDTIVSPIDGVVDEVNISIGKQTTKEPIMIISETESGYILKFKFDKESAEFVQVGDIAQIKLLGETKSIDCTVSSITDCSGEDSGKIEITVVLPEGKGEAGMSASVEINKQTERYDTIVPISSVRESASEGKYVLIIEEQNSILGNQLIVQKYAITELDRDNSNVAIGGIGNNQIVINSNKPIVAGDRVRLLGQ